MSLAQAPTLGVENHAETRYILIALERKLSLKSKDEFKII